MKTSIAFLFLLITVSIYGQADFSGTWKLNSDKSEFGHVDPSTATSAKWVIDQKPGNIVIQRNDGPKQILKIDSTAEFELAGKNGNKTKVSIKQAPDKEGLIETRIQVYADGQSGTEAKRTRTWQLSDDKKTLIVNDHIELTDGQTMEMTLVFDRQ